MLNTPVLLLIFNRPDLTKRVFDKIRSAKPLKLFIGADGPRHNRDGEMELCELTRNTILEHIDWECEVHTLFRDKNLGCKMAVSSAITWFFENVEEGIILEDDTCPDETFFTFCSTLLNDYRHDERVSFISGTSIPNSGDHLSESYYFSKFSIIWGWATWRRVWKNYDVNIKDWKQLSMTNWLVNAFYGNEYFAKGFERMFNSIEEGFDTWDFQLFFLNLKNNSLNIHPSKNLIKNIGFDERGTHTRSPTTYSNQEVHPLMELKHPPAMAFDIIADNVIFNSLYYYDNRPWYRQIPKKINYRIKKIFKDV